MSARETDEPACAERGALVIESRPRDLGGFSVRRVLPAPRRRLVGPFVFFDEMGPATFEPGTGMDVRPHPHIGLATVTYLFEGEVMHRDSLGTAQLIVPGEVNWMTAGRGIVHSERVPAATRERGARLHGIQVWVALPREHEEVPPAFEHHAAHALPRFEQDGVALTLIVGSAYGRTAPTTTFSPMFYLAAEAPRGGTLRLPAEHAERAVYVVSGEASWGTGDEDHIGPGAMVVLDGPDEACVELAPGTRCMLLGGAHLEGQRTIFWNFVSSSPERVERAKQEWRDGRFPVVPGDEQERIPLPE